MPGIRDILELLGDIPRLGNLVYRGLVGYKAEKESELELLRRWGLLPPGESAGYEMAPPDRGGVTYASPDDFPLAASHGAYTPEPSRSMRMTLNGRDITDEAGALSGGFGLPQGTRRNGGGFSQGTMDDGSVPSRAGSLLSLAEGAAVNALQGNRGADATARSIAELLYGGSQLEQSPTLNRLRAAEAAALEKGPKSAPMSNDDIWKYMKIASEWDPLKSGPMPSYDEVMAMQSGGGSPRGNGIVRPGAAVNEPIEKVAATPGGKWQEIWKGADGKQYGRIGEEWFDVLTGKKVEVEF